MTYSNRIISNSFLLLSMLFVFSTTSICAAGDLDPSFGNGGIHLLPINPAGGESNITGSAQQSNGKLVFVGNKTISSNPVSLNIFVFRLNANGTLDSTFDSDGIVQLQIGFSCGAGSVAVDTSGKIVIAGARSLTSGGFTDSIVTRLNPDGSSDTSFGNAGVSVVSMTNGFDSFADLRIMPDGRILVGGSASTTSGVPHFSLAMLSPNGSSDLGFGTDGKVVFSVDNSGDGITSVGLQSNGKIIAAGQGGNSSNNYYSAIARFLENGQIDSTFGTNGVARMNLGGPSQISDITMASDDSILSVGYWRNINNRYEAVVLRNSPNGPLDTTFGNSGRVFINVASPRESFGSSITIDHNNSIIISGHILDQFSANQIDLFLGRLFASGSLDSSFGVGGLVFTDIAGSPDYGREVLLESNGKIVVSGSSGTNFLFARYLSSNIPGVSSFLDLDGDQKTDLSIFRPNGAASEWWWLKSSGGNAAVVFGANTDTIVPADYTGDGKTDIAFWRPSNGNWFVLRSEDFSFFAFPFGANGDVPVPADYDGDGKADSAVFRASAVTWFINKSTGGTDIIPFGSAGDKPVPGDFDGDGKGDLAVFRPNGGTGTEWWVRRSSNASVFALQFGTPTDKAVPGDYTGDGKADVAFWRPSNGNWFVLRSEDFSFFAFPFGANGDTPVPGNYDGDGRWDAGVFRPSNNTWFIQRTTAGTLIQTFGITGDLPLPSAFVR